MPRIPEWFKGKPEHWELAYKHAGLGVGHRWNNMICPAYVTLDPADCNCTGAKGQN